MKWNVETVNRNLEALKFPSVGIETEDFSARPCYLCRRPLAGQRHDLRYVYDDFINSEWICIDCALYVANGDLPEDEDDES